MTEPTAAVQRAIPPALVTKIGNPILRTLVTSPLHGVVDKQFMVLHVRGRKTGTVYDIVTAKQQVDAGLAVFSNSPWRVNLRGGADLEVTEGGRRRTAHATLVEDPDVVVDAYGAKITEYGWEAAQRRLGIKITVGRAPTREELLQAVTASGLSIIRIDLH